MSGLLIGILAARTVSGVVGEYLGWRAMYGIAAAVTVALGLVFKELLPKSQPEGLGISYIGLLRSIGGLLRDEPVLRQSCLFGATGFAAFSVFWTTLAFQLAGPRFHYGSGVIGLFGLVGIVGALAAPVAGRASPTAVQCPLDDRGGDDLHPIRLHRALRFRRDGRWHGGGGDPAGSRGTVGAHFQPVPDLLDPP